MASPPAPPPTPTAPPCPEAPATGDPLLDLAGRLALADSLTAQVETTLPEVARTRSVAVAVFAVAGSRAAGVRCWPTDPVWARAVRDVLAPAWETGPLTLWSRRVGVVAPVRMREVFPAWGTEGTPVLRHDGRVLAEVLVIPVARTGATVATYFAGRYEHPFDADEVAWAHRMQAVLVASHGRFLRPPDPTLTTRQHDVLRLLAEGRTVRAIASRLAISPSTVDKHVRDVYHRLGTQDRASTVRAAQLRGLLDGLVGEDWQDLLIAGS